MLQSTVTSKYSNTYIYIIYSAYYYHDILDSISYSNIYVQIDRSNAVTAVIAAVILIYTHNIG